jgi:hypothetical protein
MNVLERAECLLDAGSSGNMNFTVIVRYRGCLEASALRSALATVQAEHLLLRSTVRWQGDPHGGGGARGAPPLAGGWSSGSAGGRSGLEGRHHGRSAAALHR